MELALSLGDPSKPFKFLDKTPQGKVLGFWDTSLASSQEKEDFVDGSEGGRRHEKRVSSTDPPPLQLDLLPFSPVPRRLPSSSQTPSFPWLADHSLDGPGRGFDVNRVSAEEAEEGGSVSSPNSTAVSSFEMDFGIRGGGGDNNKRELEGVEAERASSRASDDDENGSTRKKLRLSKDQSAFLEESFKEHSTLNPKRKLALAKQMNLRPRQVEVWFQNRRARTKLKQTEVDCEYLKRSCETLKEENKRLQKEVQELRALKTSQPFFMHLPPTTLTMCPSCERVVSTSTATTTASSAAAASTALSLSVKPKSFPFSPPQVRQAAAS